MKSQGKEDGGGFIAFSYSILISIGAPVTGLTGFLTSNPQAMRASMMPRDRSARLAPGQTRRLIRDEVNPQEAELLLTNDEGSWEVQQPSPLHVPSALPFIADTKQIRVTSFLLSTVRIIEGARLMLCVGTDTASDETLLALSPIAESPATVPSSWTVPIGKADPHSILATVSAQMIAQVIGNLANKGDCFILHDPHPIVVDVLKALATKGSFEFNVTTSSRANVKRGWQYIEDKFSRSKVRGLLSSTATKFINLSQDPTLADVGALIAGSLPAFCDIIDTARIVGISTELRSWVLEGEIASQLKLASLDILKLGNGSPMSPTVPVIPLQDISEHARKSHFTIADCTGLSVSTTFVPLTMV
jgi:hybrid polyketide synthase/nonribosomal peptide synthetase ACE1